MPAIRPRIGRSLLLVAAVAGALVGGVLSGSDGPPRASAAAASSASSPPGTMPGGPGQEAAPGHGAGPGQGIAAGRRGTPGEGPPFEVVVGGTRFRGGRGSQCGRLLELAHAPGTCSHGPDLMPELRPDQGPDQVNDLGSPPIKVTGRPWPCVGTGSDGKRAQLLYVYETGKTNRLASLRPTFESIAQKVETVFDSSAAKTGASRLVRFVTTSGGTGCGLSITAVAVDKAVLGDFGKLLTELKRIGYASSSRVYLSWVDANTGYCGIGELYPDDTAGSGNMNNLGPAHAAVASVCWDYGEPHEIMHMLGGVQYSAPRTSGGGHCRDKSDVMCYEDGANGSTANGLGTYTACPSSNVWLFDCNGDDYFHTSPPAGSYLATHWNTANSQFLLASSTPTPTTTTTSTTTTSTTTTTTTATTSTSTTTTTSTSTPTTSTSTSTTSTSTSTSTTVPSAGGARFTPLAPARILDTRDGNGAPATKLTAGQTLQLQVTGRGGVPTGATAALLNITVTEPQTGGYVTAHPCDTPTPLASNLNFTAGQTIPNLVAVRLDTNGRVCLATSATTHLIADVAGAHRP